jgi:hypothetical protein
MAISSVRGGMAGMPKILHISGALAVAAAAVGAAAATGAPATASRLPDGGEPVNLDPRDFTTKVDNPYFPLRPGSRWVYRETDSEGARGRDVVTATRRTRLIANGIRARVVHDVVTEDRQLVEVTDDFYAQDRAGNVWYLGEDTTTYENGKPKSTEGSFEAGVDGAQAGVIMPARPRVGMRYRQEWYAGHAEDRARVMSRRQMIEVPLGFFRRGRVVMTAETNPLEPRVLEYKFYARGVGPALAVSVSGESDREELVRFRRGR